MIFETFAVGPLGCNAFILGDPESGEAIVVDGGDGVDEVMARLEAHRLRATLLVHTHAHIDHINDVGTLRERSGARALLHPGDLPLYRALDVQASWIPLYRTPRVVDLDGDLQDGDRFNAGPIDVEVLHTPGHTPGSVCFCIKHGQRTVLLTGDTLFAGAIGRWDLGGTSMEDIVTSIRSKLLVFPDGTEVIAGHGAATSIGRERAFNPYLQ